MFRIRGARRTRTPWAAAWAVAVLLGAAAPATGAVSPGDAQVRRAWGAVDRLERVSDRLGDALLGADDDGIGPVVRISRRMRAEAAGAVLGMRRAAPTSMQGRRMRRLGIEVALMHREVARLVVAVQRAQAAGRRARGGLLLLKTLGLLGEIEVRGTTARSIVLPDPEAFVERFSFVGSVSAEVGQDPEELPVLATAGGTMTGCALSDYGVGWRHFALGVHGVSLVDLAATGPDGSTDRLSVRVGPGDEGVEVTRALKARGNGVYRLVISQGGRILMDAAVTRACA